MTNTNQHTDVHCWEFPPNPQLLNIHTRSQLTREMAEKFFEDDTIPIDPVKRPWLIPLLSIEGITEVHLLRHHLRIRKSKTSNWDDLQHSVRACLVEHWPQPSELGTEEDSDRKLLLPLPTPWHPPEGTILAFEGVDAAQAHPLAKCLFDLPGIILATLRTDSLRLKRGGAFQWSTLRPQVDAILQQFSTTSSLPGIQG